MSAFSSMFSGGKNPADAAMPYYEQIPDILKQYLQPFVDQGMDSMSILSSQYGDLVNDPTSFIDSIMNDYTSSAGYKAQSEQMLGQAANTSAAGGFTGTSTDVYNQSKIVNDLMAQDQQQYLQNALGVYGTGLQGEQSLFNTGYNAAGQLSSGLAGNLSTEGSLAFQGQAQKNASNNALMSSLAKAAGAGAGFYFGGVPGATAASKFF